MVVKNNLRSSLRFFTASHRRIHYNDLSRADGRENKNRTMVCSITNHNHQSLILCGRIDLIGPVLQGSVPQNLHASGKIDLENTSFLRMFEFCSN